MTIKLQSNIDIDNYLKTQKFLMDNKLKSIFEDNKYSNPKDLWDALRYSLLNGGKRIRGILCLATNEGLSNSHMEDSLYVACSIELLHSMSLIHDDLPCMDNDDLRRGKPSCHKAFSESTAILVGDAMLSLAFNLIAEKTNDISQTQKLEIISTLSKAFSFGLVPGQILDISIMGKKEQEIDLNLIENISKLKTAELIKASVICGGIISLSNKNTMDKLHSFGERIGIAFQIIDDILDITSDTKTLGKTSGKDEKHKKPTYPMLIGIENSKKLAKDLALKAKSALKDIELNNSTLFSIVDYIINRAN